MDERTRGEALKELNAFVEAAARESGNPKEFFEQAERTAKTLARAEAHTIVIAFLTGIEAARSPSPPPPDGEDGALELYLRMARAGYLIEKTRQERVGGNG